MLTKPITTLKGIGSKRAELFNKLGIFTIRDLLYFLPRDYLDYSHAKPIKELLHGEQAAIAVEITKPAQVAYVRSGLNIVSCEARDENGTPIILTWYNQPFRKNSVNLGQFVYALGRVDTSRGRKLINPSLTSDLPGIIPVYPLTKGLSEKMIRDSVKEALDNLSGYIKENIPNNIRTRFEIPEINFSLTNIHFPVNMDCLSFAKRRLAFEDMLIYSLMMEMIKATKSSSKGIRFNIDGLEEEFFSLMPFPLTNAQKRAIHEIALDMGSDKAMNRLLQGDVGSGKTCVALFCMFVAVKNGYQAVMMAPTEILASQHIKAMQNLFGEDKVCLLKGGMKKSEKEAAYEKIRTGEACAIAGTHALIEDGVEFKKLGMIIADEQHRFGVRQRAKIGSKGKTDDVSSDVLIMSATPIPRTLALLLYGDLQVSILDELPPGRKPIITRYVPQHRRNDMYKFIENQVKEGRQAYVVCPLVEKSEMMNALSATEVYDELKTKLNVNVALLHGQMKNAEKDKIIDDFRLKNSDVLVSTTVIEVGVDVPNATVMVIENADRFGLAQLHQLRGRVGRGKFDSFCFLLSNNESSTTAERLSIMTKTQNGFVIAEKDLEMRGPGELIGMRQHGLADFSAMRFAMSMNVLNEAREAAKLILSDKAIYESAQDIINIAKEKYEFKMKNVAAN